LPGVLDELPPVADLGAHSLVLPKSEKSLGDIHHVGIDLRHVDCCGGVVRTQEHRQRPSAETDDEHTARFLAQRQSGQGDPRIGQLQMIRISRFHDALPPATSFEEQRAHALVVLGDDDRVVRRGLFVDYGLGRASQDPKSGERRRAKVKTNRCATLHLS